MKNNIGGVAVAICPYCKEEIELDAVHVQTRVSYYHNGWVSSPLGEEASYHNVLGYHMGIFVKYNRSMNG